MGAYRATILLLTAGMIVLHLLEWLAVPTVRQALHGCRTADQPARRMRLALRLEASYYLVAFPAFCGTPNRLIGSLMMVSAVYHWMGLALFEIDGFRHKGTWAQWKAIGRSGTWAIGMLDLAEVVALATLSRVLYAFPFLWQ